MIWIVIYQRSPLYMCVCNMCVPQLFGYKLYLRLQVFSWHKSVKKYISNLQAKEIAQIAVITSPTLVYVKVSDGWVLVTDCQRSKAITVMVKADTKILAPKTIQTLFILYWCCLGRCPDKKEEQVILSLDSILKTLYLVLLCSYSKYVFTLNGWDQFTGKNTKMPPTTVQNIAHGSWHAKYTHQDSGYS